MKKLLEKTRYLSLIGVFSLLIGSIASFGWGIVKTVLALVKIITTYGQDSKIPVALIEIIDAFLIAVALLVFAVSLYELFIEDLNLPDWMLAHNLHDLKAKLSSVVVLVMATKFLEYLAEWNDANSTLLYGISVAVVAGMLIAFGYFGNKD
jgi:uncharacterized membrane protein YqhA